MAKFHAASLMLLLSSFTPVVSMADSWMPPTTTVTTSADGQWRMTVVPRGISSQLDYFQDKVKDKPNAGAPAREKRTSASARMEHRVKGKWNMVWEASLVNEVSPVDVLVAPGGAAASLDNWHSMGYGDDVVVIYNATGHPVRAFGLKEFLPEEFIQALPRSVSSMDWRGEAKLTADGRELIVPVVIPTPQPVDEDYLPQKSATSMSDSTWPPAGELLTRGQLGPLHWRAPSRGRRNSTDKTRSRGSASSSLCWHQEAPRNATGTGTLRRRSIAWIPIGRKPIRQGRSSGCQAPRMPKSRPNGSERS